MKLLWPDTYTAAVENQLELVDFSLNSPKKLAESILWLSDFYIKYPEEKTPWSDKRARAAYLSYYLPLNFIRLSAVHHRLSEVDFFAKKDAVIDFGSGPGVGYLSWNSQSEPFNNWLNIETDKAAMDLYSGLYSDLKEKPKSPLEWQSQLFSWPKEFHPENTICLFSYSLTEISQLPEWALNSEAIVIVEPSTSQDGRQLAKLRESMIDKNYYAWAPCTHQENCPLLHQSKKDWCHDRIQPELPRWFMELEKHLPIKNRTLTFSYLALKKTTPNPTKFNARTVGDSLKEKGKTKQLICRGSQREFISWLKKEGKAPEIPRGKLINISSEVKKAGNELRPSSLQLRFSED